jgi:hypothetical protein
MRNVSDESCRENKNAHFIFKNSPLPPPPENHAFFFFTRLWTNTVDPESSIIQRKRFPRWISKTTVFTVDPDRPQRAV